MLYWSDSTRTDKAMLVKENFYTQSIDSIVYRPDRADIGPVLWHPTEHKPVAVTDDYSVPKWIVVDPVVQEDFRALGNFSRFCKDSL